jgi:hypothetical protein
VWLDYPRCFRGIHTGGRDPVDAASSTQGEPYGVVKELDTGLHVACMDMLARCRAGDGGAAAHISSDKQTGRQVAQPYDPPVQLMVMRCGYQLRRTLATCHAASVCCARIVADGQSASRLRRRRQQRSTRGRGSRRCLSAHGDYFRVVTAPAASVRQTRATTFQHNGRTLSNRDCVKGP